MLGINGILSLSVFVFVIDEDYAKLYRAVVIYCFVYMMI
jgi:hypothetical protein